MAALRKVTYEFMAIACIVLVFLLFMGQAVLSARQRVRDDLRRQDITDMKRALEQYYNAHEAYVSSPNNSTKCTRSDSESWFFGNASPLLQEKYITAMPHDIRESKGFSYSYCVSSIRNNQATGFYLEAMLESNTPEGTYFDEDENRKFDFRILHKNGKIFYSVCGGEEDQCKG